MSDLAKIDMLHVPYKGGSAALVDLIGGNVSLYFSTAAAALEYVKTGQLRALAVGSVKRLDSLPNVPTLREAGLEEFVSQEWHGLFVPKGTPEARVQILVDGLRTVVADPKVQSSLAKLGIELVGSTPSAFSEFLQAEMKRTEETIARHGTAG